MNRHLTTLLISYQDLMDRYGVDDPLVQGMKAEVDRKREEKRNVPFADRRHADLPSGVWNRTPDAQRGNSRRP